jgi:hypothetical protein
MKTMNLILFISIIEILFKKITLDNTVVFHKLAALRSSVVPHERTNSTTEALVDALYCCGLIIVAHVSVTKDGFRMGNWIY